VTIADQVAALKAVPLFVGLSDDELRAVLADAAIEQFPAGVDIVTQDDRADSFFLILEGRAKVIIDGKSRRTQGPGQSFGEMALLDDEPRSATVRAETDVTGLVIPSETFLQLLQHSWPITKKVMANLSRRLRHLDRKVQG
jgi:CRP/FNR family transcriptional regulator, cyclic AMP receptor protein